MYVCVYIYAQVSFLVHMSTRICMCIHVYHAACPSLQIPMYMFVCVHVRTYMRFHIYVWTHIGMRSYTREFSEVYENTCILTRVFHSVSKSAQVLLYIIYICKYICIDIYV